MSANPNTAERTLAAVTQILADTHIAFKFLSDMWVVNASVNKNWPRSAVGKFITIYTQDDREFSCILERCYKATAGLIGPYILTDRPYRDSRVVFYRYGGNVFGSTVGAAGQRIHTIQDPDGAPVLDRRLPAYAPPEWVRDPVSSSPFRVELVGPVVLNDRYAVTRALKHSADGSVYEGMDAATGSKVIIREARPMGGPEWPGSAALAIIRIEGILQKLRGTGTAPDLIDVFSKDDHRFLVQEMLDGDSVWGYTCNTMFSGAGPDVIFGELQRTMLEILNSVELIHDRGILHRDLTKTNILISKLGKVHFIDWEFGYDQNAGHACPFGFTEGYSSPAQMLHEVPSPADDIYSIGCVLVDLLTVFATGLRLNRSGVLSALRLTLRDLALPEELATLIDNLICEDPQKRFTIFEARAFLSKISSPAHGSSARDPLFRLSAGFDPESCPEVELNFERSIASAVQGVLGYLLYNAQVESSDRLWPPPAELFFTNAVSVQYGAAGIAQFIRRTNGEVPTPILDWIERQLRAKAVPDGLYLGRGGVSLVLWEAGRAQEAERLLEAEADMEALYEESGLYYGAAGWGYANLVMGIRLGREDFIDRAVTTARHLIATAIESDKGLCWPTKKKTFLGLGRGPSGVALFLTYLNTVRPDSRYLEIAARSIDFDLAHVERVGKIVLLWHHAGAPVNAPKSPHMLYGSAGVATAALRVYALTGDDRFRMFCEEVADSLATRYTNKLWQDHGRAGYCEYLLDAYRFLENPEYLRRARYVAESILPHAVERDNGVIFPGSELRRFSCDFGTGTAGIASALSRVLDPVASRPLFFDELIPASSKASNEPVVLGVGRS